MKQQVFRLPASMLLCVLLLSLGIVSCGSTVSTDNMTLKVAQIGHTVSFFPFYVAGEQHFFKEQGLTLVPDPPSVLGTGPKVAAAVEAGSVDLAGDSTTDAFTLARVDAYIRLLGTFTNDYLLDIIVSKKFEQQTGLVESSPLADKVKALVGKRIGVVSLHSASDGLVTYLFRQQGLDDQKQVTKVILGSTDAAAGIAALSQGRVDAISIAVPVGQLAEAQGSGAIFISPTHGDIPAMRGQLYGVLFARQQSIQAKPKAIEAFIRAIAQAEAWIHKDTQQAKILLAKYLNQKQALANAIFDATLSSFPETPQISQQSFAIANQFHVQAGLIAISLPYNATVASDTINQALSGLPKSSSS